MNGFTKLLEMSKAVNEVGSFFSFSKTKWWTEWIRFIKQPLRVRYIFEQLYFVYYW